VTRTEQEHHEDLLHAVERVTMMLTDAGMPRMPSRVFAYVLAGDVPRYTAAELAEGLRVSPAAISGAVRYLLDNRLLFKEREPGTRADLYRLPEEDFWAKIMGARLPLMDQWVDDLAKAVETVGPDTPGGRRLEETRELFAFLREETEALLERWQQRRRTSG
jgi:DNA-binding transcriptional regulator GbsR (MarR family)